MISSNGLIIGKFYPFHIGHEYLIDFARTSLSGKDDKLYIVVCSREDEKIEGQKRVNWLVENYFFGSNINIIHFPNDLQEYPKNEYDIDFWNQWREGLLRILPEKPDFVFASEPYGKRLSKELGARFMPLDRSAIDISGTDIRKNPFENFKYLTEPVKRFYRQTICVTGPESCGKSTLVRHLAKKYDTVFVPEYGRTYLENHCQTSWNQDDISDIGFGHINSILSLKDKANYTFFVDTDLFITRMYCEMVGEKIPMWIEDHLWTEENHKEYSYPSIEPDLYLLLAPTVPWVPDGLRLKEPTEEERWDFFRRVQEYLEFSKKKFAIINSSDFDVRTNIAEFLVNNHLSRFVTELGR